MPCELEKIRIQLESEFAVAFLDEFPVTTGHTLVAPKRHVASLFDLTEDEQAAVWMLVAQVHASLLAKLEMEGLNIGLNDGRAAGQTVMHAPVHVIPRRHGDVADSRGGVRWIIPEKAAYWAGGQKWSRRQRSRFNSCGTSSGCWLRGCSSRATSSLSFTLWLTSPC
jgi:diadenosine tetraphosphate (Ap4A) HIT family hydrolase